MTCTPPANADRSQLSDEQCDIIADAILRASGSALRHYTMQKTRDGIRHAVRQSLSAIQET